MEKLPAGITKQMFWKMCDCKMSLPIALSEADLSKPFIYERRWGVFYVPSGCHQVAMSLLLAWQHGCILPVEVADKLQLQFSDETADWWLQNTPGAAFRSSVGYKIQVARTTGLTIQERRLFGDVACVFD